MNVKVAYAGYNRVGEIIEFEFDWDSVTNVSPEEANNVQIQVSVREAIYQETERKNPIAAFVILDGDVKNLIEKQ